MIEIKFHTSPDWDWCVAEKIEEGKEPVSIYQGHDTPSPLLFNVLAAITSIVGYTCPYQVVEYSDQEEYEEKWC